MPIGSSRVFRLSGLEWLDLLRAQVILLGAQAELLFRSRGALLAYEPEPEAAPTATAEARAAALERAVSRAARRGLFRPKCLARSLALHRMLKGSNILGSRIRIGVRPQSGTLVAHAWVTLGDQVLGDDPAFVGQFTEIADARMAGSV